MVYPQITQITPMIAGLRRPPLIGRRPSNACGAFRLVMRRHPGPHLRNLRNPRIKKKRRSRMADLWPANPYI